MYIGLSDGAPTPFEDRSFVVFLLMISIEHMFVVVNMDFRDFRTFVLFICFLGIKKLPFVLLRYVG